MKTKKYNDGTAFIKDNKEVAFYSYITDRVTFYQQSDEEWHDYGCCSVKYEDLIFIVNIVKIVRKKLAETKIDNNQ